MTHDDLVELAREWLIKEKYSIVTTEISCVGEVPDALGFKSGKSTLLECKVNKRDFLSDRNKRWRQPDYSTRALGQLRYYCTPKGLIKPEELPENWGLLEVSTNGSLRRKVESKFFKIDLQNEIHILISLVRRISFEQDIKGVNIRCYTPKLGKTKERATLTIGENNEECDNRTTGDG